VAGLNRWLGPTVRSVLWFFLANVALHLALDTYVGGIAWLYPWSTHEFRLFSLPPVHAWWEANFLLHWTFLAEIALCVAAAMAWAYNRARAAQAPHLCAPHA
jgi:inner membrane protein